MERRTGWTLVNVQVPKELKDRVKNLGVQEGVSMATIAYTAMYWWVMFIMPASAIAGPAPDSGN